MVNQTIRVKTCEALTARLGRDTRPDVGVSQQQASLLGGPDNQDPVASVLHDIRPPNF